ncbi:MAG: glycosyltransferase, partial [Clostridia bacterium]|nr:glycosyltransferase [Clostridia bacterium]
MESGSLTNGPTISVIVPVYKVEQYLDACICSILAQTYRDFELILVDDGSPDRCGEICDGYALKDPRVRVIHQENQGLSGARNSGMDIAQGEYIAFVDSDDLIVPRFLEILLKTVEDAGADLSVCAPVEFSDASEEEELLNRGIKSSSYSVLTGREACIAMYEGDPKVPVNAWGKLFRSVLVEGARFPVGRIHEDQAFVPPVCYRAKTVAVSEHALYLYRTREESITRERFTLKRYDDIWAIDNCIAFFKERNEQAILKAAEDKRKRLLAT